MQKSNSIRSFSTVFALFLSGLLAASCQAETNEQTNAQALEPWQEAQKTEVWEPVPPVVSAPEGKPPSDAIVLFDGSDLDEWVGEKGDKPSWTLEGEAMTVARKQGGIRTKRAFCDVQLHVEWRAPLDIEGMDGQDRGNSGVF